MKNYGEPIREIKIRVETNEDSKEVIFTLYKIADDTFTHPTICMTFEDKENNIKDYIISIPADENYTEQSVLWFEQRVQLLSDTCNKIEIIYL